MNSNFSPISKVIKEKMSNLNLDGFIIYPTSYGIGISALFHNKEKLEKIVKEAKKILIDNGYKIKKEEFSDKQWVYRIKISSKGLKNEI